MSEKSGRTVPGDRPDPADGESELLRTTQEDDDGCRPLIDDTCVAYPSCRRPITSEDIARAAAVGAAHAREFLERNPTREEIEETYQWSVEEAKLSAAYDEGFQEVLRPHL